MNIIQTYKSDAFQKYIQFERNKKKHPFKYVKHMEDMLGIELKLYQKILLIEYICFRTREEKQDRKTVV